MDHTQNPSTVNFPNYPAGPQIAPPKFHSPLYKMAKMMMRKPKARTIHRITGRHKGILITPDVHVTPKQVKWY